MAFSGTSSAGSTPSVDQDSHRRLSVSALRREHHTPTEADPIRCGGALRAGRLTRRHSEKTGAVERTQSPSVRRTMTFKGGFRNHCGRETDLYERPSRAHVSASRNTFKRRCLLGWGSKEDNAGGEGAWETQRQSREVCQDRGPDQVDSQGRRCARGGESRKKLNLCTDINVTLYTLPPSLPPLPRTSPPPTAF